MTHLAVAAATDIGRIRGRNEDHVVVGAVRLAGDHASYAGTATPPRMVAVLDGLGGHPAGDLASGLAAQLLTESPVPTNHETVARVVAELQGRLRRHMRQDPTTTMMGTTVVAAAIQEPHRALVFGVGDSSALWFADDTLHRAVALDRNSRGWVTQCIGGGEPDRILEPHLTEVIGPGRLVLCSDGLADVVRTSMIAEVLRDTQRPEDAVRHLLALALQAGGPDNVSMVVVDLVRPDMAHALGDAVGRHTRLRWPS